MPSMQYNFQNIANSLIDNHYDLEVTDITVQDIVDIFFQLAEESGNKRKFVKVMTEIPVNQEPALVVFILNAHNTNQYYMELLNEKFPDDTFAQFIG